MPYKVIGGLFRANTDDHYRTFVNQGGTSSGKTYTITVDSIVTTGNHTDCVSFILFDPANNKPYDAYYVDLAYIQNTGGKTRWVFTVPQVEGNQLDLIACPSVPGMTDGIGAEFIGVSLCEGISE